MNKTRAYSTPEPVVTHLRDTVAIHLIVKSGERSTPCGCPLHSHRSRGVAPMTRGPGNASDTDPARVSLKALLCDPQGVEGVGKGLCTSVTASRMTDAYGASTLRVPHG